MRKVCLITGAGSGIGEALACYAASKGYDVGIMARTASSLEKVKGKCIHLGAKCVMVTGDVSVEADCEKFVSTCLVELGRIDCLINNAGISMRALFKDLDLSVLESLMNINFWGTVYCTKYALPELLRNQGSVVGVSSIAGFKGLPARTGYSASKFAMQGFLESLRCENLQTGLHVLIACPGYTASNIRNTALNAEGKSQSETPFDESKLMQPEEVAVHIFEAIAKKRLYLVLTLQGKLLVWINKRFPKLADKLTYNVIKKEKDSPFT